MSQPFRYTGREWDQATELYHYRARQYDPETGKFLQEDPMGFAAGDLNIYRYVGSNPLMFKDSSGKTLESVINAGERAASLTSGLAPVANGLNCFFGGIASVFEALAVAEKSGEKVMDVSVDLESCAAAAISQAAPLLSENPKEATIDALREQAFKVVIVRFLKGALPQQSLRTTISPTSTPAYPSTWRGRGPDLSR